jgi:hypothetical protein
MDPRQITLKYFDKKSFQLRTINNDLELKEAYEQANVTNGELEYQRLDLRVYRNRRPWVLMGAAATGILLF